MWGHLPLSGDGAPGPGQEEHWLAVVFPCQPVADQLYYLGQKSLISVPAFALLVGDPFASQHLALPRACRPSLAKPSVGLSEVLWLCGRCSPLYLPLFDSPNLFFIQEGPRKSRI